MNPADLNSVSDQEAILKIKNGEINYFTVIVARYTPEIKRYLLSRVDDLDDVSDLLQNSFISFYKVLNRFDENRPILPYLYVIARNEMKMHWRSLRRELRINEIDEPGTGSLHLQVTAEELIEAEALLKSLSPSHRLVLKLLAEGYTYEEIAKKVKRPINTIRTLIRRARLRLKELRNNGKH